MAIEFPCPHCNQLVTTADSAAGKKGRCPHCHNLVQIPAVTSSWTGGATSQATPAKPAAGPPKPATAAPHARPHSPAAQTRPPQQAVLDSLPTLTPLDSVPGLTPLGPATAPVPPSPLGPQPDLLSGDPLAGLPPVSFSGRSLPPTNLAPAPTWGAANPLGSSYLGGASYGSYDPVDDRGRKGLPWEREPSLDTFQDTAMQILGEPQLAFRQMRRQGGLLNPLAYLIIGLMVGQMAITVYYLLFQLILLMSLAAPAEAFGALGVIAAVMLIGNLIGSIIGAVVGSFVAAGVWHVILLIFGCSRGGFEGTYRAVSYAAGSIALLNVVPLVGPLIGMVMGIVVQIHAFIHAHEAPPGRVTWAVLTPYALACCCMLPLMLASLGGLLSGLQRGF